MAKRLALPVEIELRALGRLGFCGVEQRRATTVVFRLDAVRNIGNFAAHPIKSLGSGEIMEVEPGEAGWSLDVLKELFAFYFVRPAAIQKKRAALNEKLIEAGKSILKSATPSA